MSNSASASIASLQGTSLAARCHNPFFRREILKSLHDGLRVETQSIISAIKLDTTSTDTEATIEVAKALSILKDHYDSINPKEELDREYRVAKGINAADRTEPWGVVYIEPYLGHTPFLSIISPLSAALAAGNCVGLKLENTLRALPSLLRPLLSRALESDIFQIVSSAPTESALADCQSVFYDPRTRNRMQNQLVSSGGKVVAVVDRTADLSSAAEAIVAARFSFGGTSPYAPDLVLINEFSEREFLEYVLQHTIRYTAVTSAPKGSVVSSAITKLHESKDWKVSVVTQNDSSAIVELTNKLTTHVPLPDKLDAPILSLSAISSLDHAIDLLSNDTGSQLAAAYHFAAPTHAKYLSQFIRSGITFVNCIPQALLLGPPAPSFRTFDVTKRYIKDHFLRSAPVLVGHSLDGTLAKSSRDASKLLAEATQEIKESKRPEWIAIGFFEQGILIGLGIYGVPLLTCLGAGLFFGVRAGMRKFAIL